MVDLSALTPLSPLPLTGEGTTLGRKQRDVGDDDTFPLSHRERGKWGEGVWLTLLFLFFPLFASTDTTIIYFQSADTILKARLYRPDTGRSRPAIVAFHEGGFVRGDRYCFEGWAKDFTDRGFALVAADYRKMQDHGGYPQTVRDALRALEWLQVNGGRLGIDSTRIYLLGSSAGAYLAAMASVRAGLMKERPADFSGFRSDLAPVRGVVLSYGVYDWRKSDWKGDGFFTREQEGVASPLNYARYAEGAFLVFAGSRDRLFGEGQARALAGALEKADRRVELVIRPEGDHGGICKEDGELARFEKPAIFRFLHESRIPLIQDGLRPK